MTASRPTGRPISAEARLTGQQLRVLAHPLRSRLLSALRQQSPATATTLAGQLGTNTGATSYHLRQLAAVGLVVEDDRPRSGKERWWRAAHRSHGWVDSDIPDDPDSRAAADWLTGHYLRSYAELAQQWVGERADWAADWRNAATFGDYLLRLNPDQLTALNEELEEVLRRYVDLPPADGAEEVFLYLNNFPRRKEPR